jgi:hypothetical protein
MVFREPLRPRPVRLVGLCRTLQRVSRACRSTSPLLGSLPRVGHRGGLRPSRPRAPRCRRRFSLHSARSCRAPSLGLSKEPPLHRHHHRSPLPHTASGALRTRAATRGSRAAFVVSHHLDGLLLRELRGLVASRSRPWGSPGFDPAVPPRGDRWTGLLSDASPSRAFPSRVAVPTSPLAVAPSPLTGLRTRPDLEALLHARVRCVASPLPVPLRPMLSWAFPSWNLTPVVSLRHGPRGGRVRGETSPRVCVGPRRGRRRLHGPHEPRRHGPARDAPPHPWWLVRQTPRGASPPRPKAGVRSGLVARTS